MSASNKEETAFKLGILIFDEVEVLDYCGPFEVFSVAGNLQAGTFTKVSSFNSNPILII
jgi:putative intracellular protease/amidase